MKKLTGKEEIGNCLIMLAFFSMLLMSEIMKLGSIDSVVRDSSSSLFSINNVLIIIIPILIYLCIKAISPFLKFIYLLSVLPILITSLSLSSLGSFELRGINIAIIFILNVCIIKYVNKIFEEYKKAVINMKEK